MKELSYLNKYFIKYKHFLLLGVLFVTISNIFQIIPALIVRYSFDMIRENYDLYNAFRSLPLQDNILDLFKSSILIYALIIFGIALLRGVFLFLVRQTLIVMSRHIEYDLKNEIYAHYQALPLSFYRKNNTGDLMARISEDVSRVRMYLGPAIMYGLNLVTLFLLIIPHMYLISPKLTLWSLVPLPLLSVSIYFVNNIINKRSEEIQRSLSGLSTFVQEAFSGIRVIKAFTRENNSAEDFDKKSNEYKHKSLRLTFVDSLFFPLIMSLIGLSVILTVFIGGSEVIDGSLSVGNIAEFIIYVNLLTWPVTSVGWVTSIVQRAAASQKRINEFMNTPNPIVSSENLDTQVEGDIKFQEVTFTYPDSGIVALRNVSFHISPGKSLAIIGTTGSGKSTIANLICRLYDTTEGHIKIDDTPIHAFSLKSLRHQIGYVPQDVFLFSDTIENNIAFGVDELTRDQVVQAAKDADLYGQIDSFPKGFDTRIGERGITLSGGQKQRLSIARAIAGDPRLLILDDALSAVDTKTENTILNSMKRIMQGRTSIIISHRVSSAKLADKIIVLDDGVIVEEGTEAELLEANGAYRELYDKQMQADLID
ncbi:ABC transporter ATP-binding protein [Roseivirga sp. BDSF3-8]|uniref:ABC transporter ATP-binding protein n=1 Tax=Roseivirga sp. BDSF3-8 TaxID=3241598 RepID=UPI003531C306